MKAKIAKQMKRRDYLIEIVIDLSIVISLNNDISFVVTIFAGDVVTWYSVCQLKCDLKYYKQLK